MEYILKEDGMHALRHLYASHMLASGVSIKELAIYLELRASAMESPGFQAVAEAGYIIGESSYPALAHDWRRTDVEEYTDLLHASQLGTPAPSAQCEAVLARSEFTEAVRSALRDLLDDAVAVLKPDFGVLIERTFLRPIGVHERVAESLHLSFNTLRKRTAYPFRLSTTLAARAAQHDLSAK